MADSGEASSLRNPNLSNFENRVLELMNMFPKGVPEKILFHDMPEVSGAERAAAINGLLGRGVIDLYRKNGELLYKLKDKASSDEALQNADSEEKVVFDIIKESGNMGIWIRDIRIRSNLSQTQLNKILKTLENRKLIKAVKSVAASKKKVYMLYNLEPDRSLTGGAWYSSEQDFESEFVNVLNKQCLRYLRDKLDKAKRQFTDYPSAGPLAARRYAMTTLDDLWKFIRNLGISKVELSREDIECILDTLIYDGKIERQYNASTDSTLYIALSTDIPGETRSGGIVSTPCGVCPVAKNCSEFNAVSPRSCVYMSRWLDIGNSF